MEVTKFTGRANINLYRGDCMDAMAGMRAVQYSLGLVDPQYGINVNVSMGRRKGQPHSGYHKFAGGDKHPPEPAYFDNLKRVTENQIIWGANHFIDNFPFMCNSPCWLMWDKGFSADVTFAQFELAWTSFKTTCKKFDKSPIDPKRIAPTQKPVALYKWLLTNYAKQGDTILDTHGGSMSIAVACWDLGFDLDLYELDADYYAAGVERVRRHVSQMQLEI